MEHHATIRWGIVFDDEPSPNDKTYRFATVAELNAFMEGVEETIGWTRHEIIEDSREENLT